MSKTAYIPVVVFVIIDKHYAPWSCGLQPLHYSLVSTFLPWKWEFRAQKHAISQLPSQLPATIYLEPLRATTIPRHAALIATDNDCHIIVCDFSHLNDAVRRPPPAGSDHAGRNSCRRSTAHYQGERRGSRTCCAHLRPRGATGMLQVDNRGDPLRPYRDNGHRHGLYTLWLHHSHHVFRRQRFGHDDGRDYLDQLGVFVCATLLG